MALTQMLPRHLLREIAGELRIAVNRARYSRSVRRRMVRLHGCRVNIGCAERAIPGWVNLDLRVVPDVDFWDCRRGLPFTDDTVATIYCEHAFEHLEFETEAKLFLRESLRCLRTGGVLRIVVPDAGAYLRAYGPAWEPLATMRPLEPVGDGWRDRWLGDVYRTQMQLINAVFRQGNEHKYAYDEETLVLILAEIGFSSVIRQSCGISADPGMAPDNPARSTESLYIEAVK
jgi:predicted SAM-dependent methyltransferase